MSDCQVPAGAVVQLIRHRRGGPVAVFVWEVPSPTVISLAQLRLDFDPAELLSDLDGSVYIIYLGSENENAPPPLISMTGWFPPEGSTITALGMGDEEVSWEHNGEGFVLNVPYKMMVKPPCDNAWVFRVE